MKAICQMCNKEKQLIYYNLCNSCYRNKVSKVYNCYRLKKEFKNIDKIRSEKHRKALRMLLWYNKSFVEIGKVLEIPSRTISYIINKYCFRCDKYGNPRPLEYCTKIRRKIIE